jgi:hypothetical protein
MNARFRDEANQFLIAGIFNLKSFSNGVIKAGTIPSALNSIFRFLLLCAYLDSTHFSHQVMIAQ